MAKRVIDFSNYEEPTWEEYTGEDPPPNRWFNAKATRMRYDADEDQLVTIFEITDGDFKGWGRGWYAPMEPSHEQYWKTHVLFKALQGGKTTNVSIDPENEKSLAAFIAKAKPVKIKTREYNDRITLNRLAPMLEAVPAAKATATKAKAEPEPEPEDEEPLEDYTAEELEEMETDELVEILTDEFDFEDEDLPKKSARDKSGERHKKALIKAILEAQEEDANEVDGDDGDEPDGDVDEDDDFEDGFEETEEAEPEPEPAPRARRSRAAKAAPPAKKAAPAKATTSTRRRRS